MRKTLSQLISETLENKHVSKNLITQSNEDESRVIEKLTKDVRKNFPDKFKKIKTKRHNKTLFSVLYYDIDNVAGRALGYLVVLYKDQYHLDDFVIREEYLGAFDDTLQSKGGTLVNILEKSSRY